MSSTNVETIQTMYAAFGRGDIAGIVEHVADGAEWIHPGPAHLPFDGTFHGPAGVKAFFLNLAEALDFFDFSPHTFIAEGDNVAVLGHLGATVRATGKKYESDWAMAMRFRDGKLVWYRHHYDTAALAEAFS